MTTSERILPRRKFLWGAGMIVAGLSCNLEKMFPVSRDEIEMLIHEHFAYIPSYDQYRYTADRYDHLHTVFVHDTERDTSDAVDRLLLSFSEKEKQLIVLLENFERMIPVETAVVTIDAPGVFRQRERIFPTENVRYFGWDDGAYLSEVAKESAVGWSEVWQEARKQSMVDSYLQARKEYPEAIVVIVAGDEYYYDRLIEEKVLGRDPCTSWVSKYRDPLSTVVLKTR